MSDCDMKNAKKKKLEKAGWKVGSTSEFLGLTEQEEAFIELKLLLAECLRSRREDKEMTQAEVAELIGSSQSRIAKMESAEAEVSIDLLVRALLALGITRRQLGRLIGSSRSAA